MLPTDTIESTVIRNSQFAPRPSLIRLDRLKKTYAEAGEERTILDEISADFAEGEFVCLLGKSGSGKSTLLNLISGIDAPTSGHVTIRNGQNEVKLTALSEQERTLFRMIPCSSSPTSQPAAWMTTPVHRCSNCCSN